LIKNCPAGLIRDLQEITLIYLAGANGSMVGDAYQGLPSGADGIPVTAVADQGYRFDGWSDGNTNATRVDLGVASNLTLTANFEPNTYTLTYNAGTNGSISGVSTQTVLAGMDGSEVTAVADMNYRFLDWSDGGTNNPRTDLNITGDLTVTARFEVITYLLDPGFETPSAGPNGNGSGLFTHWPGWIYTANATMSVSPTARSGNTSGKIVADSSGKARFFNNLREIEPGRYRFSFWLKAENLAGGSWGQTLSFNCYQAGPGDVGNNDGWYMVNSFSIDPTGTYGWQKVTYVQDVTVTSGTINIGLDGVGTIWVDDVSVERVSTNVDVSVPHFE